MVGSGAYVQGLPRQAASGELIVDSQPDLCFSPSDKPC